MNVFHCQLNGRHHISEPTFNRIGNYICDSFAFLSWHVYRSNASFEIEFLKSYMCAGTQATSTELHLPLLSLCSSNKLTNRFDTRNLPGKQYIGLIGKRSNRNKVLQRIIRQVHCKRSTICLRTGIHEQCI